MKTRSWQDQEGNNRYTTEVVGDNLTMLGKSSDRKEVTPEEKIVAESKPIANDKKETIAEDFAGPDGDADDLPF